MIRYLKSKKDGWIFEWDEILANNPLCYEVTEEEAFPERFIPQEVLKTNTAKRRGRKAIDLSSPELEEVSPTSPELSADAGRGWPK